MLRLGGGLILAALFTALAWRLGAWVALLLVPFIAWGMWRDMWDNWPGD